MRRIDSHGSEINAPKPAKRSTRFWAFRLYGFKIASYPDGKEGC